MTVYYAILRYELTGNQHRVEWPSAIARALTIVALGRYVTVLEEGMAVSTRQHTVSSGAEMKGLEVSALSGDDGHPSY